MHIEIKWIIIRTSMFIRRFYMTKSFLNQLGSFKVSSMRVLYSRLIAINTVCIAFTSTVSFNRSFSPFSGASWPM